MNEKRKTSRQHLPPLRPPSISTFTFPDPFASVTILTKSYWLSQPSCGWRTNSQHFRCGTLLPTADFNQQPPGGVTPADWLIRDELLTGRGKKHNSSDDTSTARLTRRDSNPRWDRQGSLSREGGVGGCVYTSNLFSSQWRTYASSWTEARQWLNEFHPFGVRCMFKISWSY